jgi:hypothetical protein
MGHPSRGWGLVVLEGVFPQPVKLICLPVSFRSHSSRALIQSTWGNRRVANPNDLPAQAEPVFLISETDG